MKKSRGFTLIELLVVIAIIGLLATIVLVSVSNSRRKARDSRRVSDLRQIAIALEMYNDDMGAYPGAPALNNCATEGNGPGSALFTALQGTTYVSSMPSDPLSATTYYGYEGYNPSGSGTVTRYVLRALLEQCVATSGPCASDADLTPGGCDCTDANRYYCVAP